MDIGIEFLFDVSDHAALRMDEESRKFYELEAVDYNGETISFSRFRKCVLIVVNVASLCGFADRNYGNLAELLKLYYNKGLRVLVFPCNQYLNQEPKPIHEIRKKVLEYSDKFTVFDKVDVCGGKIHPVFKHLTKYGPGFLGSYIKWNFTKFLIGPDGKVVKRLGPNSVFSKDDEDLLRCMKELHGMDSAADRAKG